MNLNNKTLMQLHLNPTTDNGGAGGGQVTVGSPQTIFGAGGGDTLTATPAPKAGGITAPEPTPAPAAQTPATTPVESTPPTDPTTPAAPAAGVAMTEEQLAKLAQSIATSVRPPQQQQPANQPPPPMTPEQQAQFDREFNVVRVTPETFQGIMGFAPENPAQLKALETFAHGIVRQAAAMTMYQVQQFAQERESSLQSRLAPVLTSHQEAQAAKYETEFYTAHPDLKDFASLVQEVAVAEKARGTTFKSPKEAIDFVANKARTLLGNRAPSGTTQTSTQQTKAPQKPSMPTTSMGGRSGSGNSSQQPASGPKSIFGDLDSGR